MGLLNKLGIKKAGPKVGAASAAKIPKGQRIYAIGDIHGRADLLKQLHLQIVADAANYEGQKQVIYLGDMIDRGDHSKQVLDLLLEHPLEGFDPIYLMGNHEQAALSFLDNPESITGWLTWGGRETLASYGINANLSDNVESLRSEWERLLAANHLNFMESCQLSHQSGNYYFVHAGIRPGIPLEEQRFEDQLWIREPFISSTANHGAVVVHGHTISEQPVVQDNRIGIDTGAYYTGILTCLVLEDEDQRFLQTGGGS